MIAKTLCILLLSLGLRMNVVRSADFDVQAHVVNSEEDAPRVIDKIVSSIGAILMKSKAGELKFWEVSDESNKEFVSRPELRSTRCYVIQELKSKQEPNNFQIWYWIGKLSNIVTVGHAASFAAELDFKTGSRNTLRREVDGYESLSFKALFNDEQKFDSEQDQDTNPGSSSIKKRMFVIQEKDERPTLKEVVVSSLIFEEEDTEICVVLVSGKVYIRCGRDAPAWARRGAEEFASIMSKRRGLNSWDAVLLRTDMCDSDLPYGPRQQMMAFFDEIPDSDTVVEDQIMQDPNEFKENELRSRVLHQNIVWTQANEIFDPDVTKLYEDEQLIAREKTLSFSAMTETLDVDECCIMDNHEVIGLFVWMGEKSSLSLRKETAKKAESYAKAKGYPLKTPIVFVDDDDVPPPLFHNHTSPKL